MVENLEGEVWKPVPVDGFGEYYEISNMGRTKRLARELPTPSGGTKVLPEKLVATKPNADGTVSVLLSVNGNRVVTKAHCLVARAFVSNENGYRFTMHLNGCKSDNRAENIVWTKRPQKAKNAASNTKKDYGKLLQEELDRHTLPEEEWRDIKDYEGLYLVSNYGRVFSVPRPKAKAGILNPATGSNGYQHVTLSKNGKLEIVNIHRAVAEAFLDNPDNLPVINHRDEDRTNNFLGNLEFCTYAYNVNYGTGPARRVANTDYKAAGVKISQALKGRRRPNPPLRKPVYQFDMDGNLIRRWGSVSEASQSIGCCTASIGNACRRDARGEDNASCGSRWSYKEN